MPAPSRTGSNVIPLRPSREPDEALLARLREGDTEALGPLFDRYETDVNRLVWRLLGADPEHDDLVQQVFLQLLRSAGELAGVRDLRGFITTVTLNLVRSELRRRGSRRRLQRSAEELQSELSPSADPAQTELAVRALALVDRLDAEDRIALLLHVVEGHTLPEAAALCGCSLATVKRRIARGEQRFRELAANDPRLCDFLHDEAVTHE